MLPPTDTNRTVLRPGWLVVVGEGAGVRVEGLGGALDAEVDPLQAARPSAARATAHQVMVVARRGGRLIVVASVGNPSKAGVNHGASPFEPSPRSFCRRG